MDIKLGDQNPVENQQSIIVFILKKLDKEFVWIRSMDQNSIQSEFGGCPKSDHAKTHVFISIYSVFRGSVDHGVCRYIYIYIYIMY